MDSNLYHKSGEATNMSRWSVFNLYSPWFVKPYFQFHKFMKNKKITNHEKKLMHFNSIPPYDQNVRINTLF